jgi:hypothetical protein
VAASTSPAPEDKGSIEEVEIDLLLEAVYRLRGYDFRDYARASLRRRIENRLRVEKVDTITRLLDKILHDASCMDRFVLGLSVNVSAMFRDPGFFRAMRTQVFPLLRTWPYIRIWQAGCSMGEEVYSVAIMLAEDGHRSLSDLRHRHQRNRAAKGARGHLPARADATVHAELHPGGRDALVLRVLHPRLR